MSSSLYVSNLPTTVTEETLVGRFAEFGTVLSVKLKRHSEAGRTRCDGFIEMKTPAEARNAVIGLNATRVENRLMSVNRAARG